MTPLSTLSRRGEALVDPYAGSFVFSWPSDALSNRTDQHHFTARLGFRSFANPLELHHVARDGSSHDIAAEPGSLRRRRRVHVVDIERQRVAVHRAIVD